MCFFAVFTLLVTTDITYVVFAINGLIMCDVVSSVPIFQDLFSRATTQASHSSPESITEY